MFTSGDLIFVFRLRAEICTILNRWRLQPNQGLFQPRVPHKVDMLVGMLWNQTTLDVIPLI